MRYQLIELIELIRLIEDKAERLKEKGWKPGLLDTGYWRFLELDFGALLKMFAEAASTFHFGQHQVSPLKRDLRSAPTIIQYRHGEFDCLTYTPNEALNRPIQRLEHASHETKNSRGG